MKAKFTYEIKPSKRRKSVAITIDENGQIVVKTPLNYDTKLINTLIEKHSDWIKEKLKKFQRKDPKTVKRKFINGEGFLYLGDWFELKIQGNQNEPLIIKDYFYLSEKYKQNAKEVFINWYRKQAERIFVERINIYSKNLEVYPKKIKLSNAKKRWGSCSSKGYVNLNWRLVMAPIRVIDYVICHELVHLQEPNHSQKFWTKLKILMPDFEKQKEWLKENGHLLYLLDR